MAQKVQTFTDLSVRNLKPRTEQYEDKVPGHPGLRVVVRSNGSRSFVFRYSYGRKYRKLTLNAYQPNTGALATALDHWRNAVAALGRGDDPAQAVRKRRLGTVEAEDTVTAYVETFRQQRLPKLAEGTAGYYAVELEQLVDALGPKDVRKVIQDDVQRVIDKAIKRGIAAQLTTYKVARAFFNWAAPRAGVESPCEKIAAPSKNNERKRYLDDDEIRVVWKAADTARGCARRSGQAPTAHRMPPRRYVLSAARPNPGRQDHIPGVAHQKQRAAHHPAYARHAPGAR